MNHPKYTSSVSEAFEFYFLNPILGGPIEDVEEALYFRSSFVGCLKSVVTSPFDRPAWSDVLLHSREPTVETSVEESLNLKSNLPVKVQQK